jgi:phage shock protein PspC (stress-responsive transcriptional regulator)
MKNEKVILGVCSWLAERFNLNVTGIRILFVAALFLGAKIPILSVSPLMLYVILFLLKDKGI